MKETKNKAAHVFDLIALALRDEDLDDKEKKTIIKIATRMGLSIDDIENFAKRDSVELIVPESIAERINHLHDLVTVMLSDGIIHEEEIKYISHILKVYGFDDVYDNNPITIDIDNITKKLSYQKFIEEYRSVTEGVLSSIVIDTDFNIEFPLYHTELRNVGPLPKTLYIFFLLNDQPVNISDLSASENVRILESIYSMMPNADFDVTNRIEKLTNPDGLSFNSNRSLLKKALMDALPKDLPNIIDNYSISGSRNQPKYIALSKDLINIKPKIFD